MTRSSVLTTRPLVLEPAPCVLKARSPVLASGSPVLEAEYPTINPKEVIKIVSIKKEGSIPWYEAELLDTKNKKTAKGWVNSTALLGQELELAE
jgi:hypothetical protein